MKRSPLIFLLALFVAAAVAGPAQAHGGRHGGRLGVFIGVPLGWPWYYPPYYYSPPLVVEAPPRTYIERSDAYDDAGEPYYWYYCDKPRGYHPYVEKCPGGWKKVVPTPPSD